MPTKIRIGLSVIVALATAVAVLVERGGAGMSALQWIALALGLCMIGAVWLFPEAKGTRN